jgi:hypothetical protein
MRTHLQLHLLLLLRALTLKRKRMCRWHNEQQRRRRLAAMAAMAAMGL